jgi:phosphatidylinositol alpha-1,6-mannosyltransferase
MKNICLITPEIGKDKGGIQNWMYFVKKLMDLNNLKIEVFAYKESKLSKLFHSYKKKIFILATWKMSVFILPLLFTNKKIFIFVHGNEILNINVCLQYVLKYLIKRENTYFIANSNAIANLFIKHTNRKIDFIQYPFMEILEDISHKEENLFFTITRLVKRKNIENVIYAFNKLRKEIPTFTYVIAGSGPEVIKLKLLVNDLELNDRIHFVGKITEEEKKSFYQRASFFLLPSLFDKADGSIEGYGIVFVEANSYKIPVLSGNTGGMIEAVIDRKTGLHSSGSVDDIYNKIKELIKINFNEKDIYKHAQKHNYLLQNDFLNFLKEICNE